MDDQGNIQCESSKCDNITDNLEHIIKLETDVDTNYLKDEPEESAICEEYTSLNNDYSEGFIMDNITYEEKNFTNNDYAQVAKCEVTETAISSGDITQKIIPQDILEIIEDESSELTVFAVKNIPKGTTFGPFDGLDVLQCTKGCAWKLKNGKFVQALYATPNWMQNIKFTRYQNRNMYVFQHEGKLYYRTLKNIVQGKELLVYCAEDQVHKDKVGFFLPPVENEISSSYFCRFCCVNYTTACLYLNHLAQCHLKNDTNENDASTTSGWSNEETALLIELYQTQQVLYDVKSANYHNKFARVTALETIVKYMRPIKSDVTVDQVKSKINALRLRSSFTSEITKLKHQSSGSGTDNVHKVTYEFSEKLFFLPDHVQCRKGKYNVDLRPANIYTNDESQTMELNENSSEIDYGEIENTISSINSPCTSQSELPDSAKKKRKRNVSDSTDKFLQCASDDSEDQWRCFGNYVVSTIKNLSTKRLQKKCKHLITKVLLDCEEEDDDDS